MFRQQKITELKLQAITLVASAVPYLGYSEKQHRSELKELLDIDPVRTEWCAAFVNAVLEESNITSNSNHKYPYTARAFLDWGESVPKDDIQPGDIVVISKRQSRVARSCRILFADRRNKRYCVLLDIRRKSTQQSKCCKI